jgi:hypothetical protein
MAAGTHAVEAAEGARGIDLRASADELRGKAMGLLAKAEASGDLRTALQGVREAARCLELMGRLGGEIDESVHLNIAIAPEVTALQSFLIRLCDTVPAARPHIMELQSRRSTLLIEGRPE